MIAACHRPLRETFAAFVMLLSVAIGIAGCAALQKVTPFLPTPDQIACAELKADEGMPVLAIMTTCGFAKDAFEIVEHLVMGHQKAKAIRLSALLGDGGADAGKPDAGK